MTPDDNRVELFCQEFVKDFKGGPAARRAGAPEGSARSWACRTLARPEVAARIAQLKAERKDRTEVEADDVVRALANMAFADIRDLVEFRRCCCRHCWGASFGYQRTTGEFNAARARHAKDVARAQKEGADLADEIQPFDAAGGAGFDATKDPNPQCPECAGEGVGVPVIKDTRDLGEQARGAYAGVKVTKDGIEVKLHDQLKALELLGRHLGLFNDKIDLNVTLTKLASRMRNRTPLA